MKDIIKKIVIAVVVVIAIGVAVFSLTGDDPAVTPDPSTSQTGTTGSDTGSTAPSGSDSTVNADATTNQGGTQSTSDGGVQQSTDNGSSVQQPSGTQSTAPSQGGTDTTAPNGGSDVQQGTSQNIQPSQNQQNGGDVQQSTLAPTNPQQIQQANKIDVYQNIFKGGKFLMKVNDPDLGPVTMAMSGNKMFIEASMEGLSLKMLYDGDKPDEDNPQQGTWFILIDKFKKYSPISSDMIGDMNVEELTKDIAKGDGTTVYAKSTETLNGEVYECESFTDENGNLTKYYFKGDQLVRSDSISPSGEVSTTEFQEITAEFDESIFEIPAGYAKWDISWLMNMVSGQ